MNLKTLFHLYIQENEAIMAPYYQGTKDFSTTVRQEKGRLLNIPYLDYRKFGQSNNWQLSAEDELFLTELLSDELLKWFVPKVLDVVQHFSESFMKELLEAAIRTSDPSFNGEFIRPCVWVYDLKVLEYLLARYRKSTKEEKKGILKAFYHAGPEFALCSKPLSKTLETELEGAEGEEKKDGILFAIKHFWDGDRWNTRFMNKEEFSSYKHTATIRSDKKMELLLDEFIQEDDLEMKYYISWWCLPKEINYYPTALKSKARVFLRQLRQIPDNMADLYRIKKVRSPFLRIVLKAYLKWKNKWLGRGRIMRKY